ncbi:MAG TPA: histidinol-phosphatase [Firmicutes bacterium]|nr:histidinol-phosphatase [Bacillota bacterium]
MLADYHIHLERGPLTREWLLRFVDMARARGISEIGISEHGTRFREFKALMAPLKLENSPFSHIRQWYSNDFKDALEDYVRLIVEAKALGAPVKLALEVDYIPGAEDALRELIAGYPFDYIIGSVHFLGDWPVDFFPQDWAGRDVDEVYLEYFSTLAQAARSGLFDVMAHPDLVKLFGHMPGHRHEDVNAAVSECIRQVAMSGAAVEVSTAGLRRPAGEMYPAPAFLKACARAGIPITLASDAHVPEEVGFKLGEAARYARECGYRSFTTFEGRKARSNVFDEETIT